MQTFLTDPDFNVSAQHLDRMRLGKQRVECWQIYQALINPKYGWQNHPAVRMWRGYELCLLRYSECICFEWLRRGYKDTMMSRFTLAKNGYSGYPIPGWLTNDLFTTHRSNLLRKVREAQDKAKANPTNPRLLKTAVYLKHWYAQFKWTEPDNLPYLWPV